MLTWVTSEGRELGSAKIHGPCEGEIFRLGNGRAPLERAGSVRIYPRAYNLKWVELGHPWTLNFKFETGTTSGSGGGPAIGAVANSFVDSADNGLSLVRVNFE